MPNNINERVSVLENVVTNLANDVKDTSQSVKMLANAVQAGFEKVHNIINENNEKTHQNFHEKTKTPWTTIFAAITLILAINNYISDAKLAPVKLDVAKIQAVDEYKHRQILELNSLMGSGFSSSLGSKGTSLDTNSFR